VTLNGARETKDYADAYFDNLAATATAPGPEDGWVSLNGAEPSLLPP